MCSDERDIVLALASLWRSLDLRVDYSMPTEAVYVAFAEAIVQSVSSSEAKSTKFEDPETELRRLLSNAAFQCSRSIHPSSLPFWVPDWRRLSRLPAHFDRASVKLNAKVTEGNKLQLTVVYYGELCSKETDTEVPKRRYYSVSRMERGETIALDIGNSLDHLHKYNKLVDGAMICSVLNGTKSRALHVLIVLQSANHEEQEYKFIGELELDKVLPAAAAPRYHERRITIV